MQDLNLKEIIYQIRKVKAINVSFSVSNCIFIILLNTEQKTITALTLLYRRYVFFQLHMQIRKMVERFNRFFYLELAIFQSLHQIAKAIIDLCGLPYIKTIPY